MAERKRRFLAELRERYSVFHACEAAGIGRRTAYEWREADEKFAADWRAALEDAIDALEESAYQRAKRGKSDRLAELLLKGGKPERYRERHEVSGPGGGPITTRDETPHAPLTEDELGQIAGILADARGSPGEAGTAPLDPAPAVAEAAGVPVPP